MGTFAQWRKAVDKGEVRRVTYVCGSQVTLVRDVVETTRTHLAPAEVDLHTTTGADPQLWAKAFQHPMIAGGTRLLVVRDAEKITAWQPLTLWLSGTRALPGVYLLFVSNDDDVPRRGVGKRAPAAEHIEAIKAPRGFVVRCTDLPEDDAIAWIQARGPLDAACARHLLTRVAGNLSLAAGVCAKLAVFGQVTVTPQVIDALVPAMPAADFTDSLITGRKADAFTLVPEIADRDHGKLIGLLDSRLDLLAKLWEAHAAGRYGQNIPGLNPYLVRRYTPVVKDYRPERIAYRRQVLALVDSALRAGARDGAWEVLVALW